jgi:hypothetical protein
MARNRVIEELMAAAEHARQPTDGGESALLEFASEQAASAKLKIERLIVDYPVASLATAFTAGLVLGWLIKRE